MPEKIQFYPLDIAYKIVRDKPIICLFGKTTNNKQICVIDSNFQPYFYIIPKKGINIKDKLERLSIENDGQISKVIKTEIVDKLIDSKAVKAVKVFVSLPRDVPIIREVVKDWDIIEGIYEYDIEFVRRYLIDKNMNPLILTDVIGSFDPKNFKVETFSSDVITQENDSSISDLKILALDIETYNPKGEGIDFDKNPILMVSFYGEEFKKVITYKKFKTDLGYIEFVRDEKELIVKIKEIIDLYKPDILTGYNSDGFDLPYISHRAKKLRVKLDIGADYSEPKIKKRGYSDCEITGISHIDVFRFIRRNFGSSMATDLFDLNSVAQELLNEKKVEVQLESLSDVWDNNSKELEIFCEYNLRDSELTYRLCQKLLPNMLELVKIIGLPLFDISRMGFSMLVESFLLRRAQSSNLISPNKPHYDELAKRRQQSFEGAFVFEPKPGLYHKIVVFDYRSLYPSIISSHNIDPGTLNCDCCKKTGKRIPNEKFDYWYCSNKKGFISSAIEDIINRRTRVKELLKKEPNAFLEARQYGLKILANSFYGYLGFYAARWYSIESARSVTSLGRYYIHKVIDQAKNEGFEVIYSDTDSIFLTLSKKTKKDAFHFCEKVNLELPGLMELEYEGYYPAGIFVSLKEGRFGAKKKYALISDDGLLKIRGFETVRRNWSIIAKECQEKVLSIILRENDKVKAINYVKKIISNLRSKKIPNEKVIIRTQLTKEISSYDNVSPHVAIAQKIKNKGLDITPGMIIKYIVGSGSGRIRDRAKLPDELAEGDYDSDYYITNQVVPSIERIFNVLGYKKEDILESKEQKKLAKFF